jgi:hypothetical protein
MSFVSLHSADFERVKSNKTSVVHYAAGGMSGVDASHRLIRLSGCGALRRLQIVLPIGRPRNSAMTTRSRTYVFAAALLPLLAVPALSNAGESQAFDSCVKAFVDSTFEKDRPVTVHREETAITPLARFGRTYKIHLRAVGNESRKQLAMATCVTDLNGVVLSMNGKPIATPTLADSTASAR